MSLERLQLGLVAVTAATCLVSIFSAQVALALALLVFVLRLIGRRAPLPHTSLDAPIAVFCVWTLLSAAFSSDPVVSHEDAKKLVLFALFYVARDAFAREPDRERVLGAAFLGGVALAGAAILQFYFLGFDTLSARPKSFLGHYMTAAGLSMAVLVIAAARLAFGSRFPRPSPADLRLLGGVACGLAFVSLVQVKGVFPVESERLFVAALAAGALALALGREAWPRPSTSATLAAAAFFLSAWALLLSRTRNAWLGALAGLAVVAVLRARRTLFLLAAAVAAVLVLRPPLVVDRLTLTDESSRDRYYMWQAGIDMVLDKPVFGQGPGMILHVYPYYRWPEAPKPQTPHLHDNLLQIAAERGLPALAFWLWMMAAALATAWRECRRGLSGEGWVAGAALALLVAVLVAGVFEYNFGDSEVLMFTLLVAALPYALRRK